MGKKKRILFVEDHKPLLEALSQFLEKEGFEVTACQSPAAASRLLEKRGFDMLVSDIIFTEKGFVPPERVEEMIRLGLKKGLSVIVLTGAGWKEVPRIKGLKIVEKPIWPKDLLKAINKNIAEKKPRTAPRTELGRIARPDWHIKTPMQKYFWLSRLAGGHQGKLAGLQEKQLLLRELLRQACGQDWPQRELDRLMDAYTGTTRQIDSLKKDPKKSRREP